MDCVAFVAVKISSPGFNLTGITTPVSAMEQAKQRLDKWLWFARVVKSRSLATRLVEAGHVRVNGKRTTVPARAVGVGDVLTIALEHQVRVLRIVASGERRGPFRDACRLFTDVLDESRPCA